MKALFVLITCLTSFTIFSAEVEQVDLEIKYEKEIQKLIEKTFKNSVMNNSVRSCELEQSKRSLIFRCSNKKMTTLNRIETNLMTRLFVIEQASLFGYKVIAGNVKDNNTNLIFTNSTFY